MNYSSPSSLAPDQQGSLQPVCVCVCVCVCCNASLPLPKVQVKVHTHKYSCMYMYPVHKICSSVANEGRESKRQRESKREIKCLSYFHDLSQSIHDPVNERVCDVFHTANTLA